MTTTECLSASGDSAVFAEQPPVLVKDLREGFPDHLSTAWEPGIRHSWRPLYKYSAPQVRIEAMGAMPEVALQTMSHLLHLAELPKGWDSYDGNQVGQRAIRAALLFVSQLSLPNLPRPSVVPCSDGGLQIEWHEAGVDLEVAFDAAGHGEFSDTQPSRQGSPGV